MTRWACPYSSKHEKPSQKWYSKQDQDYKHYGCDEMKQKILGMG